MATVSVASADIAGNLCNGANSAADDGSAGSGCTSSGGTSTIESIAGNVVNIFSIIVGVIAVIMIIYGGFRYITSGGSSEKITAAKNSLIYAIVGLLIVALAQLIVHYVLTQAGNITGSTTGT